MKFFRDGEEDVFMDDEGNEFRTKHLYQELTLFLQ